MSIILPSSSNEFKSRDFSNLYLAEQVYNVLTGKIVDFERIVNIVSIVDSMDDFLLDEEADSLLREKMMIGEKEHVVPILPLERNLEQEPMSDGAENIMDDDVLNLKKL